MLFTMASNGIFNYIILILTISTFAFAQVGKRCQIEKTGASGICKASSDCPRAEEDAKNGISPTLCGLIQFNIPIVCCENLPEVNDNTFNNDRDPSSDLFIYPDDNPAPPQHQNTYMSKSEQKCQEYNKVVTGVIQVIPLVTLTEATNISTSKCAYNGVPLIVGGTHAQPGEFPFMTAIGFNVDGHIEWRCGGTLISEYYVLTAAHCTFSRDAGDPKIVRLGEFDLSRDDDGSVYADYNIRQATVHPDYHYPQKYNDIALIRTTVKVEFTKFIRPACLYTEHQINHRDGALATGWGKTDFASAEISDKLMKVSLDIFDNSRCSRTYKNNKNHLPDGIRDTMLCAGKDQGGMDTCQGDSGGPLLVTKKDNQCKFYIIGITSFGKSCGQEKTPAIYTKVSEYVSWIENIIW